MRLHRFALLLAACGMLAACGDDSWFGDNAPPPLPGKRISILAKTTTLQPDAASDAEAIELPPPENVPDWPQAGGYPPHAMFHLALGDRIKKAWSADVGAGGDKRRAFISAPVVAGGVVYALDAESQLSAFTLKRGRKVWSRDLTPKDAGKGSYGGGLAVDEGKLFATTGFAELIALDPGKGRVYWRTQLPAPVRGAPTARAGRVIVITVENQTIAYSAEDGHKLWEHDGINEGAALVGGTSPAVDGNVVVSAYSSGELFALRIENGTPIWSDGISNLRRTDQAGAITDIAGLPVIDQGRVFVAGNSDLTAAIDLRSGRRVWDREVASVQTPWVAGDYVFLLTSQLEVVCFEAKTGKARWVTALPQWEDMEDKSGRLIWTGPVLASDRLVVVSSNGQALAISPYTGKILGKENLDDGVTIPPIVASGTLLFVTTEGQLVAYR